jgi:hypothetical protein
MPPPKVLAAVPLLAIVLAACTGPGNGLALPPPDPNAAVLPGTPDAVAVPDAGPATGTSEQFGPYYGPNTDRRFWGYN